MKDTYSLQDACIYRPYITLKDGTRIYAKHYGKRAFRITIHEEHKD